MVNPLTPAPTTSIFCEFARTWERLLSGSIQLDHFPARPAAGGRHDEHRNPSTVNGDTGESRNGGEHDMREDLPRADGKSLPTEETSWIERGKAALYLNHPMTNF
ncbi:hypothetical protein [Streptosporangium vulgare]|uniref:hypothetical protein n=1 Tax=Streptosporangium vulgare TaxID=46190 RepID=UPI0031E26F79